MSAVDVAIATPSDAQGPSASVVDYSFSAELIMLSDPVGPRAEAIRAIRTYVMGKHVHAGRRALTICSASEGAGATFVAANLAASLAQVGVNVLLLDADMRRPGVSSFIRAPHDIPGLQQCLKGDERKGTYIAENVVDNLSVLFAGGPSGDAQELLTSDNFRALLSRCMRDYDLTIIDTPPANICADGLRVSTLAGYSMVVAKRHESFVSDISTLGSQLAQGGAQVIGTVLNDG